MMVRQAHHDNVGVENFQPITKKQEDKLERISERVYNASFVFTVIMILVATIGTAFARYTVDPNIILVPDNVFKFIKEVLYIFAVPYSIKIIGDKLPLLVQAIVAWKGQGQFGMNQGYGAYPNSPSSQFYTGSGAYQNNPISQGETGGANPNTYF